jgi:C-terminal processing protease CtpA/Prc
VLDIVEARSLFRDDIDWTRVRREAMDAIRDPETITDTHSVILGVLGALHDAGDGHSFFMSPWQRDVFLQGGTTGHEWPSGHRLDGNLGYIALPGIAGVPETLRTYGTMANNVVEAIDMESTCGWVVDLRDNWGGSYAPMVTGVESLLGDGEILRWRRADGSEKRVIYEDGHLYDGGQALGRFSDVAPYQLKQDEPPVAVLLGLETASSGEATALAFVGRPRTRSFGQLTYGFTTANYGHNLYDGSWLVLAEAWMADRTGTIHPSGVQPDETVDANQPDSAYGDPVVDAAVAWLNQQPECVQ